MKKISLLLTLIFFALHLHSQNNSYSLLNDSIYPRLDTSYNEAKILLLDNMKTIDPSELLLILDNVLVKGDTNTYKTIITYIIKEYGWNYLYIDTLDAISANNSLLREIRNNNLEEWTYNVSQEYYPHWVSKNILSLRFQKKISAILHSDQEIRRYLPNDTNNICFDKLYNSLTRLDYQHILEIVELCKVNNNLMLNNYDNGVGIYYNIQMVIWHNMKERENFHKTWDILLPYIENAYWAGKISNDIFKIYDTWSSFHYGYQFYGTLKESIEIKDKENYQKRKDKYKL